MATVRLVALHGALRAAKDLLILGELVTDADFLAIDLPGHGNAPHSLLGYSAETLAAGVKEALDTHKDQLPMVIVGESFSGLAALCVASLVQDVRHVVLIDTPLDTRRMLASQQVLLQTWISRPALRPMVAGISRDFFGLDVEKRTITEHRYTGYIHSCPVPVTMITGALKVSSPIGAGAFFDEHDAAELKGQRGFSIIEVPNAGHSVLRSKPDVVASVLSGILNSVKSD